MHALALRVELHLPDVRSLKAKRSIVKPIVEGARVYYDNLDGPDGDEQVLEALAELRPRLQSAVDRKSVV